MTTRLLQRHVPLAGSKQQPVSTRNAAVDSPANRKFHTSPPRNQADHYETLDLPPTASASDIKKQFYKLSKLHHPDHNPQDAAGASKKFVAITEAYGVLGNPSKREKYDRDLGRSHGSSQRSGSYSSSGGYQPGGRKASGLSKRRNQYRGPPPSFYKSGGWGAASDKREANMGRDARDAEEFRRYHEQQQRGESQRQSGPFQGSASAESAWPFTTDPNDVSHFNRDAHYKTQTSVEDQLRKGRAKRRALFQQRHGQVEPEDESTSTGNFFWVLGLLSVSMVFVPFWVRT